MPKPSLQDCEISDLASRTCCLTVDETHVHLLDLLGRVRLEHLEHRSRIGINYGSARRVVVTFNFYILETILTRIMDGKIRHHDAVESTF